MSILWFMLPMCTALGGGLLALFIWALRHGQFEALEDEKHRIFFHDPMEPHP